MSMKERPIIFSAPMVRAILDGRKTQTRRVVTFNASHRVQLAHKNWHIEDPDAILACPYGVPGDRLWVRETWRGGDIICYGPHYHADEEWHKNAGWKSPMCMPRWASRITLEITDVRVQRLQDISEEDAQAESAKEFWDSIDGKSHPWSSNPWVWVVTFKRVTE